MQETAEVYLVELQSLCVGLQSLLIVLLSFLYQTEYMPNDVRCQVEPNAFLHELDALVASPHVCEDQAFHT